MSQSYDKTPPSLGSSGGMLPPRKLRPLRLHIRSILAEISIDKEALQFAITLHLALYKIILTQEFFWGVGGYPRAPPL